MPRVTPPDRYSTLLDAAAAAFVEHGFQRTQMDDIAERLGVSKGTSYRAVESKDVLFVAVVAWADRPEHIPTGGLDDAGDASAVAGEPFPEAAADASITVHIIYFMPDPSATFTEIAPQ